MAAITKHELFVVDGSNIATEGRTTPSLEQLNEAVLAFIEAHPRATVTVVVDATFGHRIAKKEVKAFDEAVANNELVTPPAGAVGRGDAFVLAIADRARAGVLSNDSFQEFHGEYEWLFDEGRLIGGKPVPHVGWVFVKRNPVRGPRSRQAIRDASEDATGAKERANRRVRKKSASASAESPVDDAVETGEPAPAAGDDRGSTPEPATAPTRRGRRGRGRAKTTEPIGPDQQATIDAAKAVTAPKEHVNDLMPFLEFVELHPVGTSCTVVVESYSSHGAYARVDDVLVYIPLRLMDDPPPRSARSVLTVGEAITTVIVGYVPDRRSIDAALPHMAGEIAASVPSGEQPAEERVSEVKETPPKKTTATKTTPKKTTPKKTTPKKTTAKKTTAKKTTAKKTTAKKTTAKKTTAKTAARTSATKKATAEETAEPTPAKTPAARQAPAEQAAARKPPAEKTASKRSPSTSTGAKKTAANKTAARKSPAKKTAARKTAAKKSAASERD